MTAMGKGCDNGGDKTRIGGRNRELKANTPRSLPRFGVFHKKSLAAHPECWSRRGIPQRSRVVRGTRVTPQRVDRWAAGATVSPSVTTMSASARPVNYV